MQWTNGDVHKIQLSHGIDRIEQMGDAAVVVGTDGADLHFSAVSLIGSPEEMFDYVRKGASQGELRSHGFLYKPKDEDAGTLGLPISLPRRPGYGHLFQESAADSFPEKRFTPESTQLSWFRRSRRNSASASRRSQVSRIAFSQRRCDSRLSGWGGSVTRSKWSPSSARSFAWFAGSCVKQDSPAEAYFWAMGTDNHFTAA